MAADEIERHPADSRPVLPFATAPAFEAWLEPHHADTPGLWVKFAKKRRGIAPVTSTHPRRLTPAGGTGLRYILLSTSFATWMNFFPGTILGAAKVSIRVSPWDRLAAASTETPLLRV